MIVIQYIHLDVVLVQSVMQNI